MNERVNKNKDNFINKFMHADREGFCFINIIQLTFLILNKFQNLQ